MTRFLTEFTAADGSRYAGPMIVADSWELAEAINLCLQSPHGHPLTLLGELVETVPAMDRGDTVAVVRPLN